MSLILGKFLTVEDLVHSMTDVSYQSWAEWKDHLPWPAGNAGTFRKNQKLCFSIKKI